MTEQTVDFGFRLRSWQSNIADQFKRFNVLVIHRRAGKSLLAVLTLFEAALSCTRRQPRFGYVTPQLNQGKREIWSVYIEPFAAILKKVMPGLQINRAECYIEFPHNNARIMMLGADNPDSLRGGYLDGVVLDEVGNMKRETWGRVIRPRLADAGRLGWCLVLGTPAGPNLLKELYDRAAGRANWFSARLTVDDTDVLSRDELQALREDMTENEVRSELYCDFGAGTDNTLIPLQWIEAARRRALERDHFEFAAKILGVDCGGDGDDPTVLMPRQGLCAFSPLVIKGQKTMRLVTEVLNMMARWQPDLIAFDTTGGYGAGAADVLEERGVRVSRINFASEPDLKRFANRRAEMWWRMRTWFENGGAIPNDLVLEAELNAPTYGFTEANRLIVEKKVKVKQKLGRSPDRADALALTFAELNVLPREQRILHDRARQLARAQDYNPLAPPRSPRAVLELLLAAA